MSQVIVVGGGLAGLSAAHTVLERGGRVLVLDKNPFFGGNSTKATSGINGALTRTQVKQNIHDSVESFYEDTALSARDLLRPDLVKVLTGHSASAVEWLQEKFGLDLSLVSRLGGHSFPRTHRGKERFPGMTITYALMEKLEDLAQTDPQRVRIIKKARATRLLTNAEGHVVGVVYEHGGKEHEEHGPVILATGGYAADFEPGGLLSKYCPDVLPLPTTNGEHSTGDGIKMTLAVGGVAAHLDKVQVHPTGLVDPSEPDAKVKFLAAEALRGVGGILLDAAGRRFCDELGHRDYVTGEMWKNNKPPYRLILNSTAGQEIEWHCKHYKGRGLMKHFATGHDLAKEMGVAPEVLVDTFKRYNEAAAAGKDQYGKRFFAAVPFDIKDSFWVAIVTPVVHYTMGGLEIDDTSAVLTPQGPLPGLFAAGELAGGVHGANRLGGSSLLGCVVYGRVSGNSATRYLLSQLSSSQGTAATAAKRVSVLADHLGSSSGVTTTISQSPIQTQVHVEPSQNRVSLHISWDGPASSHQQPPAIAPAPAPTAAPAHAPAPAAVAAHAPALAAAPAAPATSVDRNKEWTLEEVAKHNKEDDCWVIVNGEVLDVTSFLSEHPGGKKAILLFAGRDATEEFNMLHKPDVVEKYAPECIIGRIKK
jgi:flavocytochrome c